MIDDPVRLFQFRLAGHLGMTVNQLLNRLSHSELLGWMAYYKIEPFGPKEEEYRLGMVGAAVYNVHRSSGSAPIIPTDLFPPHTEYERELLLQERIKATFRSLPRTEKSSP